MGNYFNELRCKIIRTNNLLQFIHQVTIEIRFRKSLGQERFKSNFEFRNQIIVSSIKFCEVYDTWYVFSWFSQVVSSQVDCLSVLLLNLRCTLKPSCPGDEITQRGKNVHFVDFSEVTFCTAV